MYCSRKESTHDSEFFKFGFPETIIPLYCAVHDTFLSKSQRLILGLEAIGTLLHHSAASLVICMLVTGTLSSHRSIFEPILVLCIQHWFVLLKHLHQNLYVCIEFVLDIWFQWSVFSNFELYSSNHWTAEVAALGMLIAHWLWILAGGIGILYQSPQQEGDTLSYHNRRGSISQQIENTLHHENPNVENFLHFVSNNFVPRKVTNFGETSHRYEC